MTKKGALSDREFVSDITPAQVILFGFTGAFVLSAIKHLVSSKYPNFEDMQGLFWIKASSKELRNLLYNLSERSIQQTIQALNDTGVLISKPMNDDPYDRTLSHAIQVSRLDKLTTDVKQNWSAKDVESPSGTQVGSMRKNLRIDAKNFSDVDSKTLKDSDSDSNTNTKIPNTLLPSADSGISNNLVQTPVSDKRKPKKVKAPKVQIPVGKYFAVDHSLKAIHLWEFQTEQEGKDKLAQANKPDCFEILSTGACENLHNQGYSLVHHRKRALVFDVVLTHGKGFGYPVARAHETAPEVDKSVGGRVAKIVKVYADRKGMTVNEVNASPECAAEVKAFMDDFSASGLWGDIRDAVKFITRYNEWINNGKKLIAPKKVEDNQPYRRNGYTSSLDSYLNNTESFAQPVPEREFGG